MLAIDSSTTTPLGFGLTMEPSHVTHDGKRWYLRQLVRQDENGQHETNPDGTDRYSLALFDGGENVVWRAADMTTVRRRIQRPPRAPTAAEARHQLRVQKKHVQLAKEQAALKRWMTKLKRAFHTVEKQQQRIARLERQLAELVPFELHEFRTHYYIARAG